MAESREYANLVKHSEKLEIALSSDTNILHFLNKEGFINDNVYDETRDPKSTMSPAEKSYKVVNAIRNKVKLNPQNYHKLLHHFRQDRRSYGDIADILDNEFIRNESEPQMNTASHHHLPVTNSPDNLRPTSK